MKKIFFGILIFVMASCSRNIGQTQPVPVTNQYATPATVIASLISDSETESSSLNEAYFTPTPTNTPEPLLTAYELPAWMKSVETEILVASITNDFENTRKVAFFNAATGESYKIPMPENVSGFFWYDNANFGLLSKDLTTAYKINFLSGQVISEDVAPYAVRLLEAGSVNGLKIVREAPNSSNFTFETVWKKNSSKTKKFTAHRKEDWHGIVVVDSTTDEIVWELTTPNDTFVPEFEWSPVNENQLAYIQGKLALPTDFISKDVTLNIVDVTDGSTVATYSGDFGRPNWSSDGNMIIYQDSKSMFSNYGVGFQDAPCILFLNLGESRCLRSIPRIVLPNYQLLSTGLYQWGKDNKSIYYIYLYQSPGDFSFFGNLCVYSLVDGHINCPTQNLDGLRKRSIIGYSLSPSEQYIHICISDASILNDYVDNSNDGIIKIDGTGFFSWVGFIQEDGPQTCSFDTLWRPLP